MKTQTTRTPTAFQLLNLAAVMLLAFAAPTKAAQIWKAGNDDNLNLLTSWWTTETGTANPGAIGSADVLRFGGSGQGASRTLSLGGNLAVGGLRLDNNTGTPNYNVIVNAGSTLTLNGASSGDIGYAAGGMVLNSGAGGSLTVNCDITLGAAQQWVTSRALTVGGNINNGGFLLTVNTATTTLPSFSGVVSGAGGFTKSGNGTLTLSQAASTFSGQLTVSGGTLAIAKLATTGNNSSIGTGNTASSIILNGGTLTYTGAGGDTTDRAIDMRAGAAINNNGSGTIAFTAANVTQSLTASPRTLTLGGSYSGGANTFASIIGNSGTSPNITTLAKSGASIWTLTGASTYSGSTTINQGTLRVTGSGVLGGATGSTADAGNIWFTGTSANGTVEFETTANLGPADQVRFRNTGGTAGTGGNLKYIGTTSQAVSKTIQCDSSIGMRLESDSVGGAVTFNGAFSQTDRPLYLGGTGSGDNTFNMVLAGASTLTKRGTGTWLASGNSTFTGGTTILEGTLKLGHANGIGKSGSFGGQLTLRSGNFDVNGQQNYSNVNQGGAPQTWLTTATVTLGGVAGGTPQIVDTGSTPRGIAFANATALTYDATGNPGTATIAARWAQTGTSNPGTRTLNVGDSTATAIELDFTGGLGDTNAIDGRSSTIQKSGAGAVRISSENQFPALRVTAGKLVVNHALALGTDRTASGGLANLVTVDGGTLDLNGFNPVIGGLSDGGVATGFVRNDGGVVSTLTVGSSGASNLFGGVIQDGSSALALVKTGAGTLTLAGNNTYSGTTTVSNGTLRVNGSITGGNVAVVAGGTLDGIGTVNAPLDVQPGGTLSAGTSIGSLTIGGMATLSGIVQAEIATGPTADRIDFTSSSTLGGILTVTAAGGLVNGETFDLFDFTGGAPSGTFSSLNLPGGAGHWNITDLYVGGTITFNNASPSAPTIDLTVNQGESVTFTFAGSKYSISPDTDGDAVTVTGTGGTPTLGTKGSSAGTVNYTSTGATGTDTFTYTVADAFGATATGNVNVQVLPAGNGANITGISVTLPTATVTALGIPGAVYSLQYTDSLTPVSWTDITGNATASGTGIVVLTDPAAANPGPRYYRTKYVSGP